MPSTKENRLPIAKLRLAKAVRSTIGSRAVSTRAKNPSAEAAEIAAKSAMVSSCSQSLRGPSSSTYSSAPRKPAMNNRPHQSKFSNSLRSGLSKSTSHSVSMVTAMPATTVLRTGVGTRELWAVGAAGPAWISVSDADTIGMPRMDMNIPNTMARKGTSRRGSIRSSAPAAAAPTERRSVGRKGRESAVALMRRPASVQRGAAARQHRQAVLRLVARVDADHDRHAGPQQPLAGHAERHPDAHPQALHHLGEVAGRVVGRQQREHRARPRRHARDRSFDRAAGQRVDCDRHLLAGLEARELRLLQVGVDIDIVERDEAREPLTGLHEVADL